MPRARKPPDKPLRVALNLARSEARPDLHTFGGVYSQAVGIGVASLSLFTPERPVWGVIEAAHELELSTSTAQRYFATLHALGYLEQLPSRKYQLGTRATDLGLSALNATRLRRATQCRRYLEELRSSTGYSAGVGVLNGGYVVYVHYFRSHRGGQVANRPNILAGVRVPAHRTSIGKALIAFLPDKDRKRVLARAEREEQAGHTITSATLREQLQAVAELGYAVSDEEFHPGERSLAVPIRDESNTAVAAIDISVYNRALSIHQLVTQLRPHVEATAEKVAQTLRYHGDNDRPSPDDEDPDFSEEDQE